MIDRCESIKSDQFANYGGRGILVCREWRESFETFLRDMGERPVGMTIDRIDVNGHYSPENCRWVTPKQQCRNKRDNRVIEFDGYTRCIAEWAEIMGAKVSAIRMRLAKGWTVERTLTTPIEPRRPRAPCPAR